MPTGGPTGTGSPSFTVPRLAAALAGALLGEGLLMVVARQVLALFGGVEPTTAAEAALAAVDLVQLASLLVLAAAAALLPRR